MINEPTARETFILRRAFWTGRAQRGDVVKAFNISPNLASMAIKDAATSWRSHIQRVGRMGVMPVAGAQTPPLAAAPLMLELFERKAPPRETGIFPEELTLFQGTSYVFRGTPAITEAIMRACITQSTLEILYVGLKRQEAARWRLVAPVALEFTGAQWRVLAIDVESDDPKTKTFVLARVLGARATARTAPKNIADGAVHGEMSAYRPRMDPELTEDQIQALKQEYGIRDDGTMLLRHNLEFEFRRDFCANKPRMNHLVWPVFIDLAEGR